jgi:hypothetical protein
LDYIKEMGGYWNLKEEALDYQVKKTEMGRTCDTYGGEERCIQGFSEET